MNESIETVLNSFLMEMYKWEDNANKHIDAGTDIPDEILKQTLKEIYDKYLTDKPRKMGKLECMTVNYPPTFNPDNEKIIEIEEKGSSITVKSDVLYAGMEAQRLYKFKNKISDKLFDNFSFIF